jgi:hypothetical protein
MVFSVWTPACAGVTISFVVIPAKAGIQSGKMFASKLIGY